MRQILLSKRDKKVRRLFMRGDTLQSIGDRFKVSRERIRQIVQKIGLKPHQGGRAKRSTTTYFKRKLKKMLATEKRIRKNYGCSLGEYQYIMQGQPFRITASCRAYSYSCLKRNCERVGMPFRLTFYEWFLLWKASGKESERGKRAHRYVMSRINRRRGYSFENTEIITLREALSKRRRKYLVFEEDEV